MNYIKVNLKKVMKKNGKEETSPYAKCKVAGSVGGNFKGKTRTFLSHEDGDVRIAWEKGEYLTSIFVNGVRFDGHYLPGRSYTIKVYNPVETVSQ